MYTPETSKKETYAMHAILIQPIYQEARENKKNTPANIAINFLNNDPHMSPLDAIKSAFARPFIHAIYPFFRSLEGSNHLTNSIQKTAIKDGIDTAVNVMGLTFKNIAAKYKEQFPDTKLTPEELVNIARRSYPFIGINSSVNGATFENLIEHLIRDLQSLALQGDDQELALTYTQEASNKIFECENYEEHNEPTLGCPARPIIKDMWGWYCDTTQEVFDYLESQGKPITLN
jgi:hypothetical protein